MDQEDQDLVQSIANQYANYLSFSNSTNEQAANVDGTIDYMLARIDEFGAFVETIKSDTDRTDKVLIPALLEKTTQVQQLFPLIDKLHILCQDITKNLNEIDDRLNQAEKHLSNQVGSTSNPLKWVLSNLQKDDELLQQLMNNTKNTAPKFEPLKIHNTTEFFKQLRNDINVEHQQTPQQQQQQQQQQTGKSS
ncbi:hypothetical protein PPL_05086 [Heterostelium album PN500]|uniref:Uncharacterized protein n=1 Tax=Heterostelium pallidum (strain ATCC 26659 / Pp 5 / PN500) TaxID=670386 RepID=D3B9E2_HETP5|nr:hypothetical protein PPL_05086 [Heterostelium album PN500]EFA81854.1 hypothetical protein PPL_05086 [Heterostelium album PN500]|eukprot:XP_020433971.1 hypothetical protein PPL_05086 [Heterostelium album PN500]